MSVTEVAEAVGVSEASVVRLCQQVGAKGFQDLKIALARDLVEPVKFIHEDVRPGDDVATVIEKVFRSDMQALAETLKVLDPAAMQRAVDIILGADRVEFYGIGSAGPVAVDAYYRMLRIGINCVVSIDSHMQAVGAALAGPHVAVVAISHSGSTKETVDALRLAKQAGAKTICITNYGRSPIQAYADVVLYTAAAETMFRTEAMTSRIAELSIVDALYVCVALANVERSLANIARTADALSVKRF
jgi:DNA-binding MurR/RpiR family transcriptional regulator